MQGYLAHKKTHPPLNFPLVEQEIPHTIWKAHRLQTFTFTSNKVDSLSISLSRTHTHSHTDLVTIFVGSAVDEQQGGRPNGCGGSGFTVQGRVYFAVVGNVQQRV